MIKVKNLTFILILVQDVPEGPKLPNKPKNFHKFCEITSIALFSNCKLFLRSFDTPCITV